MALILTESFEYNPHSDKWNVTSPSNTGGLFRTGSKAMGAGGSAARTLTAAEEHATLIGGIAFQFITAVGTGGELYFMRFSSDSNSTEHVNIAVNATTRAIEVYRGSWSGGTLLGSSVAGLCPSDSAWRYIEAKVTLHDSAGSVVVRLDDTEVINLSGVDTKNSGTKTVLDTIRFHVPQQTTSQNNQGDDVYLCNGAGSVNNNFLGPVRIEMLKPDGNGASSQWTGSDGNSTDNYALVDDAISSFDAADYVAASSASLKDTYAFGDSTLPTGNSVKGVMVYAYAKKSDAGARGLDLVARSSGGTETTATPPGSLVNGVDHLFYSPFETKPGGGAWTVSDVNGAQFGINST